MKKKTQIENRLRSLHCTLEQGYNRGKRVWYAGYENQTGVYLCALTSGITCLNWWHILDEAHDDLFKNANVRADNYND